MKKLIILGLLIAAIVFSGCTGKQEEMKTVSTNAIDIKGFAFVPASITITKGTTVTWTNSDTAPHTVTSESGSELASGELSKGQTYSYTFNDAETYYYKCVLHSSMKGIIIVK